MVNSHQTETAEVKQGYELQANCGSEPLPSQMKTPGESKGSRSTRETTQGKVHAPLLFYTHIKNATRGERVGRTCQKVKFNKTQVRRGGKKERKQSIELKRKKATRETVFLLISSTHQMANITLDDGHFAKERKKARGREMKKGLMYLIIRWS